MHAVDCAQNAVIHQSPNTFAIVLPCMTVPLISITLSCITFFLSPTAHFECYCHKALGFHLLVVPGCQRLPIFSSWLFWPMLSLWQLMLLILWSTLLPVSVWGRSAKLWHWSSSLLCCSGRFQRQQEHRKWLVALISEQKWHLMRCSYAKQYSPRQINCDKPLQCVLVVWSCATQFGVIHLMLAASCFLHQTTLDSVLAGYPPYCPPNSYPSPSPRHPSEICECQQSVGTSLTGISSCHPPLVQVLLYLQVSINFKFTSSRSKEMLKHIWLSFFCLWLFLCLAICCSCSVFDFPCLLCFLLSPPFVVNACSVMTEDINPFSLLSFFPSLSFSSLSFSLSSSHPLSFVFSAWLVSILG